MSDNTYTPTPKEEDPNAVSKRIGTLFHELAVYYIKMKRDLYRLENRLLDFEYESRVADLIRIEQHVLSYSLFHLFQPVNRIKVVLSAFNKVESCKGFIETLNNLCDLYDDIVNIHYTLFTFRVQHDMMRKAIDSFKQSRRKTKVERVFKTVLHELYAHNYYHVKLKLEALNDLLKGSKTKAHINLHNTTSRQITRLNRIMSHYRTVNDT